jgi:hypothetical protein
VLPEGLLSGLGDSGMTGLRGPPSFREVGEVSSKELRFDLLNRGLAEWEQ